MKEKNVVSIQHKNPTFAKFFICNAEITSKLPACTSYICITYMCILYAYIHCNDQSSPLIQSHYPGAIRVKIQNNIVYYKQYGGSKTPIRSSGGS